MRACNWNVTASKKIYFRPDDPRASLRYDSPKKCPTILYRVNLWLETVSSTCDRPISRSALQTRDVSCSVFATEKGEPTLIVLPGAAKRP